MNLAHLRRPLLGAALLALLPALSLTTTGCGGKDICTASYKPTGTADEALRQFPQLPRLRRFADQVRQAGAVYQIWLLDTLPSWSSCHLYLLSWDGTSDEAGLFYSTLCYAPEAGNEIHRIDRRRFQALWDLGRTRVASLPANLSLRSDMGTLYYFGFFGPDETFATAVQSPFLCPDHPDFAPYRTLIRDVRNLLRPGSAL